MIRTLEGVIARFERGLRSRAAPAVFGIASALAIYWLMGSLSPAPWVYDEAAYLLQAKIFGSGHWAVPGPPLPEFFEQLHVLVTPRLVPKYPPGHALLMVPGIWLGLPALIPLLWSGITGALIFAFARSLANGWVGFLTWIVWITAPVELYIRPSFMSQTSTTLLWLLAWWCLARWRGMAGGGGRGWLMALAALMALGLITRPITTVALGIPVLIVGLRGLARGRAWLDLVPALVVAAPIVAIAPLWSWSTIGRAYPTPYSEYSRVYTPWNLPGFTVDRSAPLRPEIPAIQRFRSEWLPVHEAHTVRRLPRIMADRFRGIATTFWGDSGTPGRGGWSARWVLAVAALVGLLAVPIEVRVALWGGVALFLAMLSLASRPLWTVYYLELSPVLAFVTALGVWRVLSALANRYGRAALAPALLIVGLLVAAPGTTERLIRAHQQQIDVRTVATELRRAVDSIPGRAVVFVESGPAHRPYESYVLNQPDWAGARVWVVQDRGADNQRLLAVAPDRAPYRFDPGSGSLRSGSTR